MHAVRPILDGKQICALYEIKQGKHLKPLLDELLEFQMVETTASREDAEAYMIGKKTEFLAKYCD